MGCDSGQRSKYMAAIIFQSTHPHGVRRQTSTIPSRSTNFNPRTHMGCDFLTPQFVDNLKRISIHAPTWGATQQSAQIPAAHIYFNPRTHMGCDPSISRNLKPHPTYFNPRTHMGCDSVTRASRASSAISIHAPTWGATIVKLRIHLKDRISIHAPTWGATLCSVYLLW